MVKVLYVAFGASALARYAVNGLDANTVLMTLGCLTLIYGEIRALFERELKRMLAFSTIAQIGEIAAVLGIGTALASDAALLHVTNHAMMKTLLFYAAGAFILAVWRQADRGSRRAWPRHAVHRRRLCARQLRHHGPAAVLRLRLEVLHDLRGGYGRPCRDRRADAARRNYRRDLLHARRQLPLLLSLQGRAASAKRRCRCWSRWACSPRRFSVGGFAPGWQLNLIAQVGDLTALRGALASGPLPGLIADWPAGATIAIVGAVAVLARRPDLDGVGRAARGRDAGRGARRRDRPVRALRPAVVLLRRADRRRRRAQHAALHRLPRRQPSPGALLRRLHGDDRRPDRHDAGEGHLQLLRLLGADELVGAVGGDLPRGNRRGAPRRLQVLHLQHRRRELHVPRPGDDCGAGGNVRVRRARRGVARASHPQSSRRASCWCSSAW